MAIFRSHADLAGKQHLLQRTELERGLGGQRPRTYGLAVKAGPNEPMVRYMLCRDRRGMRKFNPEYLLYRQRNNRRGNEELVMMAKRRGHVSGGASYYINNLEGGDGAGGVRKKAPNYCGKLRILSSKLHVMYNDRVSKGEVGVIIYSSNTYNDDEQMGRAFDHSLLSRQATKPSVVLPVSQGLALLNPSSHPDTSVHPPTPTSADRWERHVDPNGKCRGHGLCDRERTPRVRQLSLRTNPAPTRRFLELCSSVRWRAG